MGTPENSGLRRGVAIVVCAVLGPLGACVDRPSDSRCRAMAGHVVKLHRRSQEGRAAELAAEVAEARRSELVAMCIEDGTAAEVECVLESESLDRLQRCRVEVESSR